MNNYPELLLSYILWLGLDYHYDPDRDVLVVRTKKHSRRDMFGRFYLDGGDDIVELYPSVGYQAGKRLIDTARQLAGAFGD